MNIAYGNSTRFSAVNFKTVAQICFNRVFSRMNDAKTHLVDAAFGKIKNAFKQPVADALFSISSADIDGEYLPMTLHFLVGGYIKPCGADQIAVLESAQYLTVQPAPIGGIARFSAFFFLRATERFGIQRYGFLAQFVESLDIIDRQAFNHRHVVGGYATFFLPFFGFFSSSLSGAARSSSGVTCFSVTEACEIM